MALRFRPDVPTIDPRRHVTRPPVDVDARGTLSTSGFNRNGSPRNGKTEIVVLHSTESGDLAGHNDIKGVISWWRNPASGGAAHIIVDEEGSSGLAGRLDYRMPHVGHFNYNSIGIEMIGFARFGSLNGLRWWTRRRQLHRVARWLAHLNLVYGVPLERGVINKSSRTVVKPGVMMHWEFSGLGTDHTDPGKYFPIDKLLGMAQWYRKYGWVE